MKHSSGRRISLEELEAMSKRDRRRMIVMGLGVVVLAIAVVSGKYLEQKYAAQEQAELAAQAPTRAPEAELYMPPFQEEDRAILARIADDTPEQRMRIDQEVKQTLLSYSNFLTPRHFEVLGVRALDAAALTELATAPGEHRMDPFLFRGEVLTLGRFQPEDAPFPEYRGRIALESGGGAAFAVVKDPGVDGLEVGSFVRMDGLFMQQFRTETEDGWAELPFFCGRELTPSTPAVVHDDAALEALLATVQDDTLQSTTGIPEEAQWALLAKCEQVEESWEEALELDSDTLTSVFNNPAMYRGRAFQFPISRNMGLGAPIHGENPLRVPAFSTGWIGNLTWLGPAPVVKWIAATGGERLLDWEGNSRFVEARGYFLKNVNYEGQDGRPLRAPVFVLESIAPFIPESDERPRTIMFAMLGGTLALIGLFWMLLTRDRKEAERLQREMVRRRQERRARQVAE
jgi:hypothetical protein